MTSQVAKTEFAFSLLEVRNVARSIATAKENQSGFADRVVEDLRDLGFAVV